MALGSQVGTVSGVSDLTGLLHEYFVSGVKKNCKAESPTAQVFAERDSGPYLFQGEYLVGATDLTYAGGAMGTIGRIPDHLEVDATQWQTTPKRRYRRLAIDNFIQLRGSGPGAFDDLLDRLMDQMWDSYKRMLIRHAVGTSNGTLCKVSSRTSGTVFVVKDGYGHAGTAPTQHLEVGMKIAFVNVNNSNGVEGAATISAIAHSTNTVTIDSETTWEPANDIEADDLIVMATTHNIATDYFNSEYTNAYAGLLDIVDPDAGSATYNNINGTTYPRWNAYLEASSTYDHIEVTEHWQKLRAKSQDTVGPQSHVVVAFPAMVAELARTLLGYQQQANLGQTLEGGYQTVRIAGMDFLEDQWQLHDVMYTLCLEDLFNVDLGGEAGIFDEDGSQWSRTQDFDAKEMFLREYGNNLSDRLNRHSALTGVSLANVTAADFDPTPA